MPAERKHGSIITQRPHVWEDKEREVAVKTLHESRQQPQSAPLASAEGCSGIEVIIAKRTAIAILFKIRPPRFTGLES